VKKSDQIIVCWCDNGTTDGKFTEGLVYSIISSGLPISSAMRVQGNQIGRQRQEALNFWYDKTDFDWVLWVDSDIVLTNDALQKVWQAADAKDRPVVTGTYFISKENERSLMAPYPAVFNWVEGEEFKISYVHPLPKDALIKVGSAGFGFVLMHRSAVTQMRKVHGAKPYFNETGVGEQFISEDINFFRLMHNAGVPLYTHTGAVVQHMKRFSLDVNYYKFFWDNERPEG
jgi:glycosyltransferase involved in cell wall biosynthesis